MSSEKLNSAIVAIKLGAIATGSRLLNELLMDEPSNETAWIWLTTCVDDVGMKIYYLKKALSINPNNQIVIKALSKLEQPPQPTLEEILPNQVVKKPSFTKEPISNEAKHKVTAQFEKPALNMQLASSPVKKTSKTRTNRKIRYIAIIDCALLTVLCGICLLIVIMGSKSSTSTSSTYNETDAIQLIQNWKAPANKGMSCKEVYDSIVYVNKNNLVISDATVKWSAVKQSESLFIVHASLKGETGWADYNWQVKFPEEKITSLGELNLCKSSDNTPIKENVSPLKNLQPQIELVSAPSDTSKICFPPTIPGITYSIVKTYLNNMGVTCNPMVGDAIGYSSICEGKSIDGNADIRIELYGGNQPDDIYLILSSVTQLSDTPSDEISANILGSIARIPNNNSNPEQAQLWVENHISSYTPNSLVQEQPVESIGGVRYHMSCASTSLRCLAIGQGSGSGWDYECNNQLINTATSEDNLLVSTNTPLFKQEATLVSTIEPTSVPPSIVKTGSGNSIVSIEKWDGPALIHIKGTPSPNSFISVTNDDGLFLALSFDEYDGVKVLDFFPGHNTKTLDIKAGGEWSIEIYPLQGDFTEERILDVPGKYQGNDDDVLFIEEGRYQIVFEGNSASTNFYITTHGEFGESYLMNQDLIVNVTEPYKGTIDIPEWVRILVINAVGPWTVEITNR